MSKESVAFEVIKNYYSVERINTTKPYEWKPIKTLLKDECEIVESALKAYEETDNQLNGLFDKFGINDSKDLLKKLKVLDIIKNNMTNTNENNYYGVFGIFVNIKKLTKKEIDLLKEVLL